MKLVPPILPAPKKQQGLWWRFARLLDFVNHLGEAKKIGQDLAERRKKEPVSPTLAVGAPTPLGVGVYFSLY